MKRKSRGYQSFLMRTGNINYRDTAQIVEQFNSSVSSYKRFASVLKAGDDGLAARKLHEAATRLYQCVEWALKNYLDKRYNEMETLGSFSQSTRILKVEELSRKNTNLIYLVNEFKKVSSPKYVTFGINVDIIVKNAADVNNLPKHNAAVPDPNAYRISINEVRKIIVNYLDTSEKLDLIDDTIFGEGKSWYELSENTADFSTAYSYILITNRLQDVNYQGLFSINWDMIIDFDSSSDIDGLIRRYQTNTHIKPWIKILSKIESKKKITHSNMPYWVLANGTADIPESVVSIEKWKNKTGKYLGDLLENFHKEYTKPAKVFMVPIGNEKATEKITDAFTDIYDENVDFAMLSADSDYSNIDLENFKTYKLTLKEFSNNLQIAFADKTIVQGTIKYEIPAEEDNKFEISESYMSELRDSFEIVYLDCALADEKDALKTSRINFYCGNTEISWYGLREQFDVIRAGKETIINKINEDMKDRGRLLRKVYYEPGMGGTTLLRRIAWEMREKYPTMILKKCNEQTSKNIQKLYDSTHLPHLILADNNLVNIEEIKDLQGELKRMGFAFVIVFFERKLRGQKSSGSIYTVISELSQQKAKEMKSRLVQFVDNAKVKDKLDHIVNGDEKDEKSPFIMSMYAFDEKFKGIKPYISKFLVGLNKPCRKILFALALADYGNVPMDIEYFTDMFEDDSVEQFLIEEMPGINELVRIENISRKKYIKIKYHLFAEEILRQLSGGYEAMDISFYSLMDDILEFIEDSRKNQYVINHDTMKVLRNLFITRIADEDSEKPAFSSLIIKLKEETRGVRNGQYDDSNDAIIRIFNKLVEVYPEEAHFTAHLARYYFYIDKNFEKGFEYINKAIELSETMEEGNVDPLLYHMKAMGYASLISNVYIRQIYQNQSEEGTNEIAKLIIQIEEAAINAFGLFKVVRQSNIGLAGHISEINLCIKIANMAKNLVDESEVFNAYMMSTDGEWAMKYVDRAMDLWDECKKMITDIDSEDFNDIDIRLNQLDTTLEHSIELWEEYIPNATGKNKTQARRLLARAYDQRNKAELDKKAVQLNLRRIVDLMQENMDEESTQTGNIRLWFEAIKRLEIVDQGTLIMDAIIKLNRWITLTDSVEAHYYRFVLKFIQAMQGSSLAENELPKLLRELKSKSVNLYNRTVPQHWLSNSSDGLGALISNSRNRKNIVPEEEMAKSLRQLTGRISSYYVNDSHAYIKYKGVEVYFNPSATKGEIDRTKINQRVKFGIGFSYDGPRAYNSSIHLLGADEFVEEKEPLQYGKVVLCEVIRNVVYYTQVRIIGYDDVGSIHINEYAPPYSEENRPKTGTIIEGKILSKKYDNKKNQNIWNVTMNIQPDDLQIDKTETAMSLALKKVKLD
ncbi:MAG: hypothetical protein HDR28_01765 [Lachnospiraceae bacterium]|nr:hypothetical protein [Lachnospiraceae bacterium]